MTLIVVALLNGKTLDQWYDWIADRVEQKVGYATPKEYPQIYSENRILAAQRRSEFRSSNGGGFGSSGLTLRGPSGFGALARALNGGAISFHPAAKRNGGEHTIVTFDDNDDDYDDYDYEEDDEVGDTGEGGLFGVNRLKVGGASNNSGRDVTKSLRDQLDELEDGIEEDEHGNHVGDRGSSRRPDKGNGDESTDNTSGLPRATINLPSPSERQGMINLNVADEVDPLKPASEFYRLLSGPTGTGSPVIPTPSVLASFGRRPNPGGVKVNGQMETPPPPSPPDVPNREEEVPPQETGRVPDEDAKAAKGQGLTNGFLDKSEDPLSKPNTRE